MLDLSLVKPLVVKKKAKSVDKEVQRKLLKSEASAASANQEKSDFGDWDFDNDFDEDEDVRFSFNE